MLSKNPEQRSSEVFGALLELPDYLENYHYERTLSQLMDMPVESATVNMVALDATLTKMQERLPAEPAVYEALIKFGLASDQEANFLQWQKEANTLGARRGDSTLTLDELIAAMDNPLARPCAIAELHRIGPNAVAVRDQLIAMIDDDPSNRQLADAAYATDINRPHPYPWVSMRGMSEALEPVDVALAASDDPAWLRFRHELDVWMIDEPHTDVVVARNLAADLADVSPELRDLLVRGMRESEGTARLAELAFGKEG